MDVVAAGPHLAEAGRLEPVLVGRAAGDRVEADVGGLLALEDPGVGAVGLDDHLRHHVLVLGGDVAVEHVRWFDDVVVDGDEDQVVHVHGALLTQSRAPIGHGTNIWYTIPRRFPGSNRYQWISRAF